MKITSQPQVKLLLCLQREDYESDQLVIAILACNNLMQLPTTGFCHLSHHACSTAVPLDKLYSIELILYNYSRI